jgi:hypothetical protein
MREPRSLHTAGHTISIPPARNLVGRPRFTLLCFPAFVLTKVEQWLWLLPISQANCFPQAMAFAWHARVASLVRK